MFSNWSEWQTLGSVHQYSVQYSDSCTHLAVHLLYEISSLNSLDWDISFQRLKSSSPWPSPASQTRDTHITTLEIDCHIGLSGHFKPFMPSLPRLDTSVNFLRVNSGWNVLECDVWELELRQRDRDSQHESATIKHYSQVINSEEMFTLNPYDTEGTEVHPPP